MVRNDLWVKPRYLDCSLYSVGLAIFSLGNVFFKREVFWSIVRFLVFSALINFLKYLMWIAFRWRNVGFFQDFLFLLIEISSINKGIPPILLVASKSSFIFTANLKHSWVFGWLLQSLRLNISGDLGQFLVIICHDPGFAQFLQVCLV